jgi:prepilin signal peptidase PulO-like enzyme (type II secretory pathway)
MLIFFWMTVLVFLLGCFIGSFLNVLIWRLPQELKANGRSFCPHCKYTLGMLDLIPVLSFLAFGGKCRYCKAKISWRYPIIELVTGILFALSWWLLLSPTWFFDIAHIAIAVKLAFIIAVIIIVFVIDLEHYLILNKVVLPATVVVLLFALGFDIFTGHLIAINGALLNGIIGAVAGFLPFYILWWISKGRWIGLGDAKYGLFLGAVFGFPFVYLVYLIACLLGTAFAVPLLATGKKHLSSKLPLGTFLSVSAILTLWFGVIMINWYLALLGF